MEQACDVESFLPVLASLLYNRGSHCWFEEWRLLTCFMVDDRVMLYLFKPALLVYCLSTLTPGSGVRFAPGGISKPVFSQCLWSLSEVCVVFSGVLYLLSRDGHWFWLSQLFSVSSFQQQLQQEQFTRS